MTIRTAAWIVGGLLALGAPAAAQPEGPAGKSAPGVDASARQDLEKGTYEPNKEYYDSLWFELASEPEHHFVAALEAFQQGRAEDAADQIRRGSTFLKMEATRPRDRAAGERGPAAEPLMDVYRELRFLAEDVEQSKVQNVQRLDRLFARAHAELAQHHLGFARSLWKPVEAKEARQAAGRHLAGSVQHTQRGLTWAKAEPRRGEAALQEAGVVAEALQGDLESPLDETEVRQAFTDLEGELQSLQETVAAEGSSRAASEAKGS